MTTASPAQPPASARTLTDGRIPGGVAALSVLFALAAVAGVILAVIHLGAPAPVPPSAVPIMGATGPVAATIALVRGALHALVARGLWKGAGWAWYLALVAAGVQLVQAVVMLLRGDWVGGAISMASGLLVGWYLTRPHVESWFDIA